MVNKRFWLGMLVLALVFGMTVVGCEVEEIKEEDPPPTLEPGTWSGDPINRVETGSLGDMTSPDSGWRQLLNSINSTRKYINLDLSACPMSGTEFNPDTSISTGGKSYIVSLILPTAATSIAAGTSGSSTFSGFSSLESISGANITTIGAYAFRSSASLVTLNIPSVTDIGENTFPLSHYGTVLTFIMGDTAPNLETSLFGTSSTRTVVVKIPSGATGYSPASSPFDGTPVTVSGVNGTSNWANGFRGAGWNGTATLDAAKAVSINLTIQQQ